MRSTLTCLSSCQVMDEAKDSIMSVALASSEIVSASLDGYTRLYDVRLGTLTTNCVGSKICRFFSNFILYSGHCIK